MKPAKKRIGKAAACGRRKGRNAHVWSGLACRAIRGQMPTARYRSARSPSTARRFLVLWAVSARNLHVGWTSSKVIFPSRDSHLKHYEENHPEISDNRDRSCLNARQQAGRRRSHWATLNPRSRAELQVTDARFLAGGTGRETGALGRRAPCCGSRSRCAFVRSLLRDTKRDRAGADLRSPSYLDAATGCVCVIAPYPNARQKFIPSR